MSSFYPEASLIDTVDGMQFKVYSNTHPQGFVIAKPKYIPESLVQFTGLKKRFILEKCMTRFNLFTSKEVVKTNLDALRKQFPYLFYECKKHNNWFLGVPTEKIAKVHDTKAGFQEFSKVPDSDLDDYLKAVRGMTNLVKESGVPQDAIGISHSTLLGNYTPGKSDIDILIFGKENGWKAIHHLETSQHPSLKWKSKEDWARYYKDRVVSKNYTEEEYVFNMVRKKDDGYFNGHVFSIFVVENPGEGRYSWDDIHTPLGLVKIRAKVSDASHSLVRPGFYAVTDVKILEGKERVKVPIKRIVTWARPFALQAKKGEMVECCGLLEEVRHGKEISSQIVLGYFDTYTSERGEQEYLKALLT